MPHEDDEARLKEYELLRNEILHYDKLVVQVLGLCFPLLGIILAQGVTGDDARIFLIPIPVLFIVSLYVADKRWATWLIAYYLRSRVDRSSGPLWETWLYVFRSRAKQLREAKKKPSVFSPCQNIIVVECLLFVLFGAVCLALLIICGAKQDLSPIWYVVGAAAFAFQAGVTVAKTLALVREGREGGLLQANAPTDAEVRTALGQWESLRRGRPIEDDASSSP